jgi:hypothetical protein
LQRDVHLINFYIFASSSRDIRLPIALLKFPRTRKVICEPALVLNLHTTSCLAPIHRSYVFLKGRPPAHLPSFTLQSTPRQANAIFHTQLLALLSLSLVPLALSTPVSLLSRQDSCADTCGSTCYTSSDISAALSAGYQLYTSGETEGSDNYPHQ